MFALIIPILNAVLGGIIKPFVAAWTQYESTKMQTGEAGFEKGAAADAAIMQAALVSDVQLAAMKVSVYGTRTYRIITLIAGLPPAIIVRARTPTSGFSNVIRNRLPPARVTCTTPRRSSSW